MNFRTQDASSRNSAREELLTTKEAADFIKMSDSFLAKKRVYGGGPTYSNLGRAVRYSKAALLDWLKSQERRSTKDPIDSEAAEQDENAAPEISD